MRLLPPRPPFSLPDYADSLPGAVPPHAPHLWVWTSDLHVTSNDSEAGGIGDTKPTDAANLTAYIAALKPAGVIDTGDCKDHYGADTGDELDNYVARVRDAMPWASTGASGAALPILPGNHDEVDDYNTPASITDFSLWDAKFWPAPYHWTCDWPEPRVRFVAFHSYIHHSTDGFGGAAHMDTTEIDWLAAQLAALPATWRAIVASHFPANPDFGNYINFIDGTWTVAARHPLLDVLRDAGNVSAHISGHRHFNMGLASLDGIPHISGPGVSYTIGNSRGGWVPITYDPTVRTLTFDYLYGPPGAYTRVPGFNPIVIQLP